MANKICSSLPHVSFMLSLRLISLLALVSYSNICWTHCHILGQKRRKGQPERHMLYRKVCSVLEMFNCRYLF
ncbi:hypothetical protein TorRG33x02_295570 [Trema orientale]|uniref:Uncharacterized protein n=1 Tax=Trema orientale TaxID=63057 RepID=A0A2P5C6T5_TREOI|nr:hypothetical protein TorRG33x02_295570 [Trema orientale]